MSYCAPQISKQLSWYNYTNLIPWPLASFSTFHENGRKNSWMLKSWEWPGDKARYIILWVEGQKRCPWSFKWLSQLLYRLFSNIGYDYSGTSRIRLWTSTILRTLYLVWNATSLDLCTIRTPEMWPPHYPVGRTLDMAPTVSPPVQTHTYSRHFANKFVGSLVKQTTKELKARNSSRAPRYHISALLVASMCFTLVSQVTLRHWK